MLSPLQTTFDNYLYAATDEKICAQRIVPYEMSLEVDPSGLAATISFFQDPFSRRQWLFQTALLLVGLVSMSVAIGSSIASSYSSPVALGVCLSLWIWAAIVMVILDIPVIVMLAQRSSEIRDVAIRFDYVSRTITSTRGDDTTTTVPLDSVSGIYLDENGSMLTFRRYIQSMIFGGTILIILGLVVGLFFFWLFLLVGIMFLVIGKQMRVLRIFAAASTDGMTSYNTTLFEFVLPGESCDCYDSRARIRSILQKLVGGFSQYLNLRQSVSAPSGVTPNIGFAPPPPQMMMSDPLGMMPMSPPLGGPSPLMYATPPIHGSMIGNVKETHMTKLQAI